MHAIIYRVTSTTSNNVTYYHHQLTYEFLKRLNVQLQYQQNEEDENGLSWHVDPTKPKKKSTSNHPAKENTALNALVAGRRCHKLVVFGLMHTKLCKSSLSLLDVSMLICDDIYSVYTYIHIVCEIYIANVAIMLQYLNGIRSIECIYWI